MIAPHLVLMVALIASPTMPEAVGFNAAKTAAAESERPILLNFSTSWCGWCKKMKKDTYTNERVIAASGKDFIYLPLDAEDGGEGSELAKRFGVRSFPTHVVVDATGRELHRFSGYRKPEALLKELQGTVSAQGELDELMEKVKESDGDPQTQFEIASALEGGKRHEAAIQYYLSLYAMEGEKADRYRDLALWKVASLYARLGDNDQALSHYEKYVRGYPDSRKAETGLYQIGRLQQLVGRKSEAVKAYEQLLARYPESRYALGVRMQLTFLRGE